MSGAAKADAAFALGCVSNSQIVQLAELGNPITGPERGRRIAGGIIAWCLGPNYNNSVYTAPWDGVADRRRRFVRRATERVPRRSRRGRVAPVRPTGTGGRVEPQYPKAGWPQVRTLLSTRWSPTLLPQTQQGILGQFKRAKSRHFRISWIVLLWATTLRGTNFGSTRT